MIKGVVFDLDHTLFDRYATLAEIAKLFYLDYRGCLADGLSLAEVTSRIMDADRHFIHFGWPRVHAHLADNGLYKTAISSQAYCGYMLGKFGEIAVPFDFSIPMLRDLRQNGYKIGLITNGKSQLQNAKLDLLGLRRCFDQIIISGEFGMDKPHIEPFLAMADRLATEPAELLYVGDHPLNDVQASRNAGYTPVWVKTTGSWVFPDIEMPQLAIETVTELPELLKCLQQ